ncbi:aldehyde dehydrogenase [Bacillus canaveralius]|uniref:Aldehyde dehydrogenase n=1 Tax=Bacillus canaveralius TaxID=1403243 RepID=A0A2N5GGE0_9BACI|nr:aldehyde dehydrogenase [Bacillus canaveralius]PLR79801.1 aldehyde dehydrogenase [Bacillus canaveralius]PLR88300.1 aldehyde dehydrogenase [Bacillus canaveralius]
MRKINLFIGGEYRSPSTERYFQVINPATKDIVAEVAEANEQDVELAVQNALHAFTNTEWAHDRQLRFDVLNRLSSLLRANLDELTELESVITGRPIREMKAQLLRLPEWYEYFASVLKTMENSSPPFSGSYVNYTQRLPLGVVGLITPWNHPLLILTKKLAPALAGGNAVVIKPSENAPVTPSILGDLAKQAGVPNGILNIVQGFGTVAGKALSTHPALEKIDVTGGTETGRHIASAAGFNLAKVAAELGGKASVLILPDANMEEAVNGSAFAAFIATGQTCVQGSRIFVHESQYEVFVEKLVEKTKSLTIGDPSSLETDIGPVISERQYRRILDYIQIGIEEGATVACGGEPFEGNGFFIQPTIFTNVRNDMRVAQEEIFGPVTCIIKYTSIEELVKQANGTDMGLAMSVWSNNIRLAHQVVNQLEAGIVWINDHHRIDPSSPWGGFKSSGIGLENSIQCFNDYTKLRNVIVNISTEPFDWFDGSQQVKRYS